MIYQDKLGVYCVGDLKFYSKLEAIEHMQRTGVHLHWDFNEAVFSSYDWTKEPVMSLPELYKRRAQQLREKYDYIILQYSGGADSDNVLQTFVDNDIKIDEIVSYVNYDANGNRDHFLNSEFFRAALPRIDQLKINCSWINHRVVDLTDLTLTTFLDPKNKFDWIYNQNVYMTANCVARANIAYKIKPWRDLIESGKKICLLWGADKPRILHIDGKFRFRFLDMLDLTASSTSGQQSYTDELFYWTPDLPEIVIKQAHIIKNYLNTYLTTSPFVTEEKSDLAFKMHQGKKLWLNNHGVHTLLYPKWNIATFSAGKTPSLVYSARDDWFWGLEQPNQSKHIWEMGINKIWNTISDYWKNDPQDISKGLVGCWGKDYFLEKL
jgi:hypothetical protein